MSEPDGPGTGIVTHKGGTRCAQEYAIEFAKKGLPLNKVAWAVFNKFHPPEEGSSNSKSARIGDTVRSKAAEMSQSSTIDPELLNDIFLDTVKAEAKKNRYFGLGSMTTDYTAQSTEACSQLNQDERQKLRDELKEELRAEIRQENAQDIERMRAEMRAEIEALRSEFIGN